ncbi:MAG TPA: hypothetical protein VGX92_22460 [Pyrinomonadaceae bacterium]|nr:hypothetical protein [Pyrinomonadaceae bacterium]
MRVGFYLGTLAYFLSVPVLYPAKAVAGAPAEIHSIVGLALLLTVVGFEAAYWIRRASAATARRRTIALHITWANQRWLFLFICFGGLAWLAYLWYFSQAIGVSIPTVLLTMRGIIEGADTDAVAAFSYLGLFFNALIFLITAAAFVLLTARLRQSKAQAGVCWFVLAGCAVLGFLSGSRAVFFYSFAPLGLICWMRLYSRGALVLKSGLFGALALVLLLMAWSAMSAMRGGDIRNFEGGWEDLYSTSYADGAFNIYAQLPVIVQAFPDQVPYEYGKSVVPLALGWVPRRVWPEKPYPFSLYANILNGETLEERSASIAVGLTGEGYGNFGLLGALVWGALVGLACRFGDDYLLRFEKGNASCYLFAVWAAIWVAMIVRGGVPEMFYMGLSIICLPWLLVRFVANKEKTATPTAVQPGERARARVRFNARGLNF